ncbi:MAG TPA: hypothetical protein VKV33_07770 [Streptosporangiaceae bacterium]|nr:hypothetical protein [Streptosporangiaceae bacterium]
MGVGDGPDDGQAEAVSFAVADALGAELPERLEEFVDGVRGDEGAGVADRYDGAGAGQGGGDVGLAAGEVVPDGASPCSASPTFSPRASCSTGHGVGVLAAWAGGALLLGGTLLRLRDA